MIGRAIAGVGSAGITTGSMLVTIPLIPLAKRPMFQGMIPSLSKHFFALGTKSLISANL